MKKFSSHICFVSILLTLISTLSGFAQQEQRPFDSVYQRFEIDDPKLGKIELAVSREGIKKKKPLVLCINGSGIDPIFGYHVSYKGFFSAFFPGVNKYYSDYHIAYINKAGVPLYDTINGKKYTTPFAVANYTLDWRAESAAKAIDFLVKNLPIDTAKVFVMGHSEGGQVAPRVAVLNKKVKKVAMLSCNALDHIYSEVLLARSRALNKDWSYEESQYVVDSLLNVQKDICAHPTDTARKWWGRSYKTLYSYSKSTPLDNMLQLNIPIFFLIGNKDINVYIASADYASLEFTRKSKINLTYKVYTNFNHTYYEMTEKMGKRVASGDRSDAVFKDVFDWFGK